MDGRLDLTQIWVTQHGLRKTEQLPEMIDFVRAGGLWTTEALTAYAKQEGLPKASPLINISCFEDGKQFLHDGMHRIISTILAGRDYLEPQEFVFQNWVYDKYLEINPAAGWFTPYDPRTYVRNPDLATYKAEARQLYSRVVAGEMTLRDFESQIRQQSHRFCEARIHTTPHDVIAAYPSELIDFWKSKPSKLARDIVSGLEGFVEDLKQGKPIPATRVERFETPDGPMHVQTKITL